LFTRAAGSSKVIRPMPSASRSKVTGTAKTGRIFRVGDHGWHRGSQQLDAHGEPLATANADGGDAAWDAALAAWPASKK